MVLEDIEFQRAQRRLAFLNGRAISYELAPTEYIEYGLAWQTQIRQLLTRVVLITKTSKDITVYNVPDVVFGSR